MHDGIVFPTRFDDYYAIIPHPSNNDRILLLDGELKRYLEIWSDVAPLDELLSAVAKAHPLAALCGALGHRYQLAHARTALSWDILSEQENLLECLRSLLTLMEIEHIPIITD